jgi:hypothetical protein
MPELAMRRVRRARESPRLDASPMFGPKHALSALICATCGSFPSRAAARAILRFPLP